jgi:hypothetical protein
VPREREREKERKRKSERDRDTVEKSIGKIVQEERKEKF